LSDCEEIVGVTHRMNILYGTKMNSSWKK